MTDKKVPNTDGIAPGCYYAQWSSNILTITLSKEHAHDAEGRHYIKNVVRVDVVLPENMSIRGISPCYVTITESEISF
jgi:hypothetical protein